MAMDLEDALNDLVDTQREYELAREDARACGQAQWESPRWQQATHDRNNAFREAVRHALGMGS